MVIPSTFYSIETKFVSNLVTAFSYKAPTEIFKQVIGMTCNDVRRDLFHLNFLDPVFFSHSLATIQRIYKVVIELIPEESIQIEEVLFILILKRWHAIGMDQNLVDSFFALKQIVDGSALEPPLKLCIWQKCLNFIGNEVLFPPGGSLDFFKSTILHLRHQLGDHELSNYLLPFRDAIVTWVFSSPLYILAKMRLIKELIPP